MYDSGPAIEWCRDSDNFTYGNLVYYMCPQQFVA